MKLTRFIAQSFLIIGLASSLVAARLDAATLPPVPDLTHGGKRDKHHDWTLGPTGARGWIWGHDLRTTEARQILITKVDDGSPASGVLEVGDVILGVKDQPFASDARIAFGMAITEAEATTGKGVLKLLRWRRGKHTTVTLKLKVMGDYTDTSPVDCPKTTLIIEQACEHLMRHGLGDSIEAEINALGLLATGRTECMAPVKALAHKVGPGDLKLTLEPGMVAWTWGCSNLFLTEYFLATHDDSVLPAIHEFTTKIAMGQSAVGTWGHGMSLPENAGGLGGYGAINQSGLTCWLSLILAQKCGVKDAIVTKAIERSHRFFSFFIGKGSIPYGDHAPYYVLHDNNGKNAEAAIALDLLGNTGGARFFSRMSTAAFDEREFGHTGNYFGYLWGPLGVARSGDAAVAAHLNEQRWFYDLARRWDGAFVYQGGAGGDDSYEQWDCTGAFLLTYCTPLRKLCITGKDSHNAGTLTGAELDAVIEDGRHFDSNHMHDSYIAMSDEVLLKALTNWSPTVRYRAASSLAKKKSDAVPQLITMLGSPDINARYGACQALELTGDSAAPAVDALIEQLAHRDQWLQIRAAYALAGIGDPARKAVPALLKLVLTGTPDDPRETTRRYLGMGLFSSDDANGGPSRGLIADSIADVDRALLLPAIKQLLATDDGLVRSQTASVYDKLTDDELDQLWPDILHAVEQGAPSGEMFASDIRVAGLELLAKHHIEEGMKACVGYAKSQDPWASEERTGEIMKALISYGTAAQVHLPELQSLVEFFKTEDFPEDCKRLKVGAVQHAIKAIKAAKSHPALRGINSTNPQP